jgi:archaellum biogenesis protein FlaJ (TadC family)
VGRDAALGDVMADRGDERAAWGRGMAPVDPDENVWASLVRATVFIGATLIIGALVIGIGARLILYLAVGK